MAKYIQISTSNDRNIIVEIADSTETISKNVEYKRIIPGENSRKIGIASGILEKTQDQIIKLVDKGQEEIENLVTDAIVGNVSLLQKAINELSPKPQEIEISFGLKFTGEGNVAICKFGGEFNYNVKLTYK